jgi:hypothetical protein
MTRNGLIVVVRGIRRADRIALIRVAFGFVASPYHLRHFGGAVVSGSFAQFLSRKAFSFDRFGTSVLVGILFLFIRFILHFNFSRG